MNIVNEIKDNPRCVASITVKVKGRNINIVNKSQFFTQDKTDNVILVDLISITKKKQI